ncbi:hypothetical protein CLV46_2851 [Diaminobutyricimonas aerilata]|uniref:Flagellar protein FlgN n=1 Tax=Diaminobutyricimonas aerilata TaxID=1162967 RepID=A0A2M9CN00_9MICO|nr:flagellar protein FlgN [Diaminobutyricimonas aerilata]PJJ73265.1 hypothetical protein CLV46_2851 [Diaminobutyricimonas aerilata]
MADKVWLNMQDLDEVNAGLKAAITDFKDATESNESAEEAVGRPDDRGELRSKVEAFEEDWNDKRGDLLENLEKLQEHLQGIIDGWQQFDQDMQNALTNPGPDNGAR